MRRWVWIALFLYTGLAFANPIDDAKEKTTFANVDKDKNQSQLIKELSLIEYELLTIARLEGKADKDLLFGLRAKDEVTRDAIVLPVTAAVVILGGGIIAIYSMGGAILFMFAGIVGMTSVEMSDSYANWKQTANRQYSITRWYNSATPGEVTRRIEKLNSQKNEVINKLNDQAVPVIVQP